MENRVAIVLLAGLFAGCSSNMYEVELRPKGDAVERTITCWEEGGARPAGQKDGKISVLAPDELRRIATAYGEAAPPSEARKYNFTDTFRGKLPGDLGGTGSFKCHPTANVRPARTWFFDGG